MTIRLHPAQAAFRRSQALYRGFVGGRGAGKSWVGAYDLLRRALPGRLYLVAAPTYAMLRDSSVRSFEELARGLGYLRAITTTSGTMRALLGNNAEILFRSADDPDRLRGPNLSGAWLDEAGEMAEAAFQIVIACLREGGAQGWLSATFTPRGRGHWTYPTFGGGRADTELFHCGTADNPFLPPGFAEGLRRQYPSAFAEQEVDGRFIAVGGRLAKREWFHVLDARPACVRWVRAWDFAATAKSTADWTVGALIGKRPTGGWALAHAVRAQVAGGQVEALVRSTAEADGRGVAIRLEQEPGSSGKIASGYLTRALAGYDVRAVPATGDKVTRAMPFLAQAEAGNVALVRGPWVEPWLDEVTSFPEGEHDDQVDASALAFNELSAGARSGLLI